MRLNLFSALPLCSFFFASAVCADELERRFQHPPDSAKPLVYWFWMGCNVSRPGITQDLQALKDAGFGGSTLCNLADSCTPWAGIISNSPTPNVIAYQSESWWKLVRHAAAESKRLGLEFGIHNCAGYESSGGPWVTPELSMQEVVWTKTAVTGPGKFDAILPRPQPDIHAHDQYPAYNPHTGMLERPEVPARTNFFRDIAVLALPADAVVAPEKVLDLSARLDADGHFTWDMPGGKWVVYRFGHTTMGRTLQPCQWDAMGLESDKMSRVAMEFHLRHLLKDAKDHLGNLAGGGLKYIWFDSYEAGVPTWTPAMRGEFKSRRGYDLLPFLATMDGIKIGGADETNKFQADFDRTVKDLYRDVYFATIRRECHAAGLECRSEPYAGPWEISEAIPYFDQLSAEFWTHDGKYSPWALKEVVAGARAAGMNLITAEAFTGDPRESQWNETPEWLKPIGDGAFCDGINRFMLHRFVHQPFGDRWRPGMAMGQWGTHFDRFQTWWEPGKAWVKYLQRCDALLQWGKPAADDFTNESKTVGVKVRAAHRSEGATDVYFVANLARTNGRVNCSFGVSGKQPELWDPVSGKTRALPQFETSGNRTFIQMDFKAAESCFIVFRNSAAGHTKNAGLENNFPVANAALEVAGPWSVDFDPELGGPGKVVFDGLQDWTQRAEAGVKYYSGTAVYENTFNLPADKIERLKSNAWLDLGTVHAVAEVRLNGKKLGVVWTAPWRVDATSAVKSGKNRLEIKVTNVWANRLIGDEQQPEDCAYARGDMGFGGPLKSFPEWYVKGKSRPSAGRIGFTTWNYFNAKSPLVPSGLLGPVRVCTESAIL